MTNTVSISNKTKNKKLKINNQKVISVCDFIGLPKDDEDRAIYKWGELKKNA